jgi:hypothetical protein
MCQRARPRNETGIGRKTFDTACKFSQMTVDESDRNPQYQRAALDKVRLVHKDLIGRYFLLH